MKNFIRIMAILVLGIFIGGIFMHNPYAIRDTNETEFESMLDWLVEDHPNMNCRAEALESFPQLKKAGEMTARIRLLESRIYHYNRIPGIWGALTFKRDVALLKHEVDILKDSVKMQLHAFLPPDAI